MGTLSDNKSEIIYQIINSSLAGVLVLLGSLIDGELTVKGVIVATIAAGIVAITKFKDYWTTQENEYKASILNFL